MDERTILIVDDEPDMLSICRKILEPDYNVRTSSEAAEALELLRQDSIHLVLIDLKMRGMSGLEIMEEARKLNPGISVIIITAYPTSETAVQAIRQGAFDYIPKPFTVEQLQTCVERCFMQRQLLGQPEIEPGAEAAAFQRILGDSAPMKELLSLARKVAPSDANLLLLGESGTGKELLARCIHEASSRRTHSFVPIDCAALPEGLLESELFGYEKGAFTSASLTKLGLLEFASGGTLFLDEIGDLTLNMQAKLLRVLQERQVRRLGGMELRDVDLRVVGATHRDLKSLLEQGQFREDLYYRLNVITLKIPPLRVRPGDIPLLTQHFCREIAGTPKKNVQGVSRAALMILEQYCWPGNVRELRNVIERAICLTESNQISIMDLPQQVFDCGKKELFLHSPYLQARKLVLESFERDYLVGLLRLHHGNVARAAQAAGINRTSFHRLLNRHHLHSHEFK